MDIKCQICGEPWDAECIHDEVAERHPDKPWYTEDEPEIRDVYTRLDSRYNKWYNHNIYEPLYKVVKDEFAKKGCEAFSYGSHNRETIDPAKNAIYGSILDFFSDDIDAAVGGIEDWDNLNG
jgi:hypothetical protein